MDCEHEWILMAANFRSSIGLYLMEESRYMCFKCKEEKIESKNMEEETAHGKTESKAFDQQKTCSLSFAAFAKIWNEAGNPPFAASPELCAWLRSLPSDPQELHSYLIANDSALAQPDDYNKPSNT